MVLPNCTPLKRNDFKTGSSISLRACNNFCEGMDTLTVFPNGVRFDSGFRSGSRSRGMTMNKYAFGAAVVAMGIATQAIPAHADKLDDVLARLDAIEKNNAKLAKENAALKARLDTKGTAPAATPAARATSMTGTPTPPRSMEAPEIDAQGHGFLEHKKGNPLTFYTPGGEITAYGQFDLSIDDASKSVSNFDLNGASPPVGKFGWLPDVSTNTSYLGVRGFQRVPNFPFNFVYQLELGLGLSVTPGTSQTNSSFTQTVNGALFNRNTWIGFANPEFGAFKIGKTDAPYQTSTGGFNPFAGQVGDYRVIMGNTGGDNRVEFATRLDNAIWYESPTIGGFQWNGLFGVGQNRSSISDNIPSGGSSCTGGNDPASLGNLPLGCNDGAWSNTVSTNLSYTNGPFYATVAYERHFKVNRQSDIAAIYGGQSAALTGLGLANQGIITNVNNCNQLAQTISATPGANNTFLALCNADVADEDAFKVAALYTFQTKTTVGGIWEMLHRYVPQSLMFQNERQRNGSWLFLTQELTPADSISFGWAHAFKTPGDPGQHNPQLSGGTLPGTTDAPGFTNNNSADMLTSTYKHKFGPNLTWYTAVAVTMNGPMAHYDLGAGGHGVTTDCHDAFAATGGIAGQPHCFTGPVLGAVSTGVQWRF
jgi:predicted porin